MRRRRADERREARDAGLAAAVGLDVPRARTPVPGIAGGHCPVCEAVGRIDMLDATAGRAYLSCRRCGKVWDTDHAVVRTG